MTFVDEGKEILSGASDNTVILWNCSNQQAIQQFGTLSLSTINQISYGDKDKILTAASSNGQLAMYDIKTGKDIVTINACNGDSVESFCIFNHNNCIITTGENGICYIYDIRKLDSQNIHCIGKIQRDERSIKKIVLCPDTENELILCNGLGSVWKWKVDINKDINLNAISTVCEWTGNDQFGINDLVLVNKAKNDYKLYVATKNYEIKEYMTV